MTILFLHGWQSTPGGLKPTYLKDHGHTVLNPALPEDDFDAAVRIAQTEYEQGHPDVVVGSSRGGAVAMNINSKDTPLGLLCPAWKMWGTATTVKPGPTILHSRADETVPYSDSEELVRNSGLLSDALIEVGTEHRLADRASLETMLMACEQWDTRYNAIHESSHALVGCRLGQTPKVLAVGRTSIGTSGQVLFCSGTASRHPMKRQLVIAVAGKVGTQVLGYRNRLVSENLDCLEDDEEPGWLSDEMLVWEDEHPLEEVRAAEATARWILKRYRSLLTALAEALIAKGELGKDEIRGILAEARRNH